MSKPRIYLSKPTGKPSSAGFVLAATSRVRAPGPKCELPEALPGNHHELTLKVSLDHDTSPKIRIIYIQIDPGLCIFSCIVSILCIIRYPVLVFFSLISIFKTNS